MMSRSKGLGAVLAWGLALLCCLACRGTAQSVVIRDGGINPADLGKGDWIYFLSQATNRLGGAVPTVVNVPTLMAYYKSQGLQYIIVKAGTGSTNFNGSGTTPQFDSNLVHQAHAAGLLIFAYTRSFDDDVPGEIAMAERCFALGADGWIIDAEAEWENGANQAGTNGPARALQYGEGLRARFPNKFIAHAPFPIISFHSSFPYREFGYYCDAVMPQAYWKSIYGNDPAAVARMVAAMDSEYRAWQNSLSGIWTNAIKPIIPLGQTYNPAASEIVTAAEVDEFFDRLRTNPAPASITGYKGASFWRTDTRTADIWTAIRTNTLGDASGPPALTLQPQDRTVIAGTAAVQFTAWGGGSKPFHYRWRREGTNLPGPGATSPSLVLTNIQFAHAGAYSVVVSNVSGVVTSAVARLTVIEPPTLFNVAAVAGARSAIVSWTSTNASSSRVEYGLSPGAGLTWATPEDSTPVTRHSVLIPALQPGTTYHFAVVSRTASGTQRSAGWTFTTAGDVILDNPVATYTGAWSVSAAAPDQFGADHRLAPTVSGGSTASAIFTPLITTPGAYDVFVWHPAGISLTTNAPVVINFGGGALMAKVNQTASGGGWRQVGTNLNFRAGTNGNVRISNNAFETNKLVAADAVRFAYRVSQDTSGGQSVPEWWAQYYFGGAVNASLDHDGDGHPTWAEYLAGTAPDNRASRLTLWSEPAANGTFSISFSPALADRRYQLEERTAGGPWITVASGAQVDPGTGVGVFPITTTEATVRFYRVKVDWAP